MRKIFLLALGLILTIGAQAISAAELYGCMADENTLSIRYDDGRETNNGLLPQTMTDDGWLTFAKTHTITTIEFWSDVQRARPTSTEYWFSGFEDLTTIVHMDYLNTSRVTSMEGMFENCVKLKELDLCRFDVSKVTKMDGMFYYCAALKTIYCNSFWAHECDAAGNNMFHGCTSLVGGQGTKCNGTTNITINNAHPDNGASVPGYFTEKDELYGYRSGNKMIIRYDKERESHGGLYPQNVDIYGWLNLDDSSNPITTIELHSSVQNARPTITNFWFSGFEYVNSFVHLDYLNTSEVMHMQGMFKRCYVLTSIDISSFNTEKLKSTYMMFFNCYALTTIYCNDDWSEIGKGAWSNIMFQECSSLVGGNGTPWDADHLDITYARPDDPANGKPGYFTAQTQGIDDVQGNKVQGTKVIRDGQLFIEINGRTYDAQGKEVK